MPALYAHYSFGQNVYAQLNEELKKLIKDNKSSFDLGLQGPDILFHYHPLWKNSISQTGHKIHNQSGLIFLRKIQPLLYRKGIHSAEYAYILGFLCHFMLDSECHPYVSAKVRALSFPHVEMETEFDKYLLEQQHRNPHSVPLFEYIPTDEKTMQAAANIYQSYKVSRKEVKSSILSTKKVKKILFTPTRERRFLLTALVYLSGQYGKLNGHIVKLKKNPKADITNPRLYYLYQEATGNAVSLIQEFHQSFVTQDSFSKRLNRNFE